MHLHDRSRTPRVGQETWACTYHLSCVYVLTIAPYMFLAWRRVCVCVYVCVCMHVLVCRLRRTRLFGSCVRGCRGRVCVVTVRELHIM